MEAKALANVILPVPHAVFDRKSSDSGHYLYRASSFGPRKAFNAEGSKSTFVELRGDGSQTMIPPSVHPNNNPLTFTAFNADAIHVQYKDLLKSVNLLAAARISNVMVTVAPENTTMTQIRQLVEGGLTVSLGHTDANFETCMAAFDAGARCVTHLFNAMSQLCNREPGLVGAAFVRGDVHASMIADRIHVHPAAIKTAIAAKGHNMFLVSDAMSTAGSQIDGFDLHGRWIRRNNGRLTLEDGTLAGADLDLTRAVHLIQQDAGETVTTAITRATRTPTELLKEKGQWGTFGAGVDTLIYVDNAMSGVKPLLKILSDNTT